MELAPKARFIEQMLLGITASQDCKLSRIARALGESISLKKTEDRLSYHLAEPGLGQAVAAQGVAHAAGRIGPETLIVIDPTDLRKKVLTISRPIQSVAGDSL